MPCVCNENKGMNEVLGKSEVSYCCSGENMRISKFLTCTSWSDSKVSSSWFLHGQRKNPVGSVN